MPTTSQENTPPEWYVPRISAVSPTGAEVALAVGEAVDLGVEVEPWQTVPAEQEWQRRAAARAFHHADDAGLEPA